MGVFREMFGKCEGRHGMLAPTLGGPIHYRRPPRTPYAVHGYTPHILSNGTSQHPHNTQWNLPTSTHTTPYNLLTSAHTTAYNFREQKHGPYRYMGLGASCGRSNLEGSMKDRTRSSRENIL